MKKTNPFSLTFGKPPKRMVQRLLQHDEIADELRAEEPSQQVFMVTGVRGVGKTVFMADLCNELADDKTWTVVFLNSSTDMLSGMLSQLASKGELATIFKSANINLSFFGFSVDLGRGTQIVDTEVALQKMLANMQKHGKRVLVAIDEATSTPAMREFASAFQIFLMQGLPVHLIMTGLYENINELQNEENLTFLYRAPKINLEPLSIGAMAKSYQSVFEIDEEEALGMARSTKGYSFAYQVVGYCRWKYGSGSSYLEQSKLYLEDYAYTKIWAELSGKDRKVLHGIATAESGKVKDVREKLGMGSNELSPYRDRLIKRGLIDGSNFGHLDFTLPFFDQFIIENYFEEE
ncbi:MAG: ATP-binding protein [Adlercreutzia sp.]|uniref:ATP-binding protein n=1 Tax=uncultured Adlercreutzia sp. TaxID=875803 RepID=UPI002170A519|nr:ATP-binding protein [uncultured Adlercreutzia sp.]MCI8425432.1 ATP-binding protein [Adlercreutzia sp.]